jgi:hypothetical protein
MQCLIFARIAPQNNITKRLIKKGSLTHNLCYRVTPPKRRVDNESTVKERIYRNHLFTLYKSSS